MLAQCKIGFEGKVATHAGMCWKMILNKMFNAPCLEKREYPSFLEKVSKPYGLPGSWIFLQLALDVSLTQCDLQYLGNLVYFLSF